MRTVCRGPLSTFSAALAGAAVALAPISVRAESTSSAAALPGRSTPVELPPDPSAPAPDRKPSPLDPVREAQRRFNLGVSLYNDGDLRGALAEFRRAHQIFPSYKVLYNLGTVSRELHDWASALTYYREYLLEGGEAIPGERRLQIERQVVDLAQRVGRLDVVVNDGPAELSLDEQPLALRPGMPVLVNPGKRRLRIAYAGRPPVVKVIEVVSGDQNRVVINPPWGTKLAALTPPAEVKAAASDEPSDEPDDRPKRARDDDEPPRLHRTKSAPRSRATAWWCWGATTLLGGGALTLGLSARQSADQLTVERTRFPAKAANLNDMSNRTRNLALAADIAIATTVVLAAISTYFTFAGGGKSSARDDRRASADPLTLGWRF